MQFSRTHPNDVEPLCCCGFGLLRLYCDDEVEERSCFVVFFFALWSRIFAASSPSRELLVVDCCCCCSEETECGINDTTSSVGARLHTHFSRGSFYQARVRDRARVLVTFQDGCPNLNLTRPFPPVGRRLSSLEQRWHSYLASTYVRFRFTVIKTFANLNSSILSFPVYRLLQKSSKL